MNTQQKSQGLAYLAELPEGATQITTLETVDGPLLLVAGPSIRPHYYNASRQAFVPLPPDGPIKRSA